MLHGVHDNNSIVYKYPIASYSQKYMTCTIIHSVKTRVLLLLNNWWTDCDWWMG